MRLRVWVAGVVPLLGMGIASAVSTEPDAVAELAAIVARERAAIEARDWRRPGGMHESGLAEEAYWRANAAAIRGDWDTVFAELAIGGRRVDTRPELRWEGGPLRQLTDDNLYSFPHQAKERVLRFCSENRIDDALATALPALTFAVDLMRRPFLVEWMVGSVAVGGCVDLLEATIVPRCDRTQLEMIAEVVQRAESWAPLAFDPWPVQMLYAQRIVLDDDSGYASLFGTSWSPFERLTRQSREAASKIEYLAAIAEVARTPSRPWAVRRAALARRVPDFESRELQWLRHLTRLRLFRMSLAFALGQEVPDLDDPLGDGKIGIAMTGDTATFTSVELPARIVSRLR